MAIAGWRSELPSTLKLDCGMERELNAEPVVESVWFGAIRVGSLDIRRQGP
jgi:hypothetical protein